MKHLEPLEVKWNFYSELAPCTIMNKQFGIGGLNVDLFFKDLGSELYHTCKILGKVYPCPWPFCTTYTGICKTVVAVLLKIGQ